MRTEISRGIFTIDSVLTLDECREYIEWSEGLDGPDILLALEGRSVVGLNEGLRFYRYGPASNLLGIPAGAFAGPTARRAS